MLSVITEFHVAVCHAECIFGEVVVRRRTLCRLSLRSHATKQCLRCIVINVDTYVDCHLHRIVANSSISDVYVALLLNVAMLNIVLRMSLTSHSYDVFPHK